jgi:uncharacterized DUF497 family protein
MYIRISILFGMRLVVVGFDWDDGNHAKCQKHGVSIAEIEALFRGGPLVAPAPGRSATEDRMIAVGRTAAGRPLFVAFTLRPAPRGRLIRAISARFMHAKEIRAYEQAIAATKDRPGS